MDDRPDLLNAVIFETPASMRSLTGPAKAESLSGHARSALYRSAELSGISVGALEKGDLGEPLPCNGTYWTVSHTSDFAAAVVAPFAVGIDLEKIRPFTTAVAGRLAGPGEWALASAAAEDTDQKIFYRFWTAKEAVLKAVGAGLGGLARCSIIEIVDEHQILLEYDTEKWSVSHFFGAAGHVASITVPADSVVWEISK
jgi:4'-phosphopantetheinyl transferase